MGSSERQELAMSTVDTVTPIQNNFSCHIACRPIGQCTVTQWIDDLMQNEKWESRLALTMPLRHIDARDALDGARSYRDSEQWSGSTHGHWAQPGKNAGIRTAQTCDPSVISIFG